MAEAAGGIGRNRDVTTSVLLLALTVSFLSWSLDVSLLSLSLSHSWISFSPYLFPLDSFLSWRNKRVFKITEKVKENKSIKEDHKTELKWVLPNVVLTK